MNRLPDPDAHRLPAVDAIAGVDFTTAARVVLKFLHERLGFALWMVTRTEGDDWVVLVAEDHGYGVSDGHLFRWSDSLCSRMADGLGPRVAPRSDDVPAYASAPIARQVAIGAYVGVPITTSDGSLFGTLCAVDPSPQPATLEAEQPLVELLAGLLGNLLARERDAEAERRRAERAEHESLTDALTSLVNRRGWQELVEIEEQRCHRLGDRACVVLVDLDELKETNDRLGHHAGDELLRAAAATLRAATRAEDVVARLGGDEFGVLAVGHDVDGAGELAARIEEHLGHAGIAASVGLAVRHPTRGLHAAIETADRAMYATKRAKHDTHAAG